MVGESRKLYVPPMRRLIQAAVVAAVVAVPSFTWGAATVSRHVFPYPLLAAVKGHDPALVRRLAIREMQARVYAPADNVFAGDSILADVPVEEMFPSALNRSIGGDTTRDVMARLPSVLSPNPKRVFLLIGVNDLDNGDSPEKAAANYRKLYAVLSRHTEVVPLSVLPCGDRAGKCARLGPKIRRFNELISTLPHYRDIRRPFLRGDAMNPAYTYDGIHLTAAGVSALAKALGPVVEA